jgi:hypothetical protein
VENIGVQEIWHAVACILHFQVVVVVAMVLAQLMRVGVHSVLVD